MTTRLTSARELTGKRLPSGRRVHLSVHEDGTVLVSSAGVPACRFDSLHGAIDVFQIVDLTDAPDEQR